MRVIAHRKTCALLLLRCLALFALPQPYIHTISTPLRHPTPFSQSYIRNPEAGAALAGLHEQSQHAYHPSSYSRAYVNPSGFPQQPQAHPAPKPNHVASFPLRPSPALPPGGESYLPASFGDQDLAPMAHGPLAWPVLYLESGL